MGGHPNANQWVTDGLSMLPMQLPRPAVMGRGSQSSTGLRWVSDSGLTPPTALRGWDCSAWTFMAWKLESTQWHRSEEQACGKGPLSWGHALQLQHQGRVEGHRNRTLTQ